MAEEGKGDSIVIKKIKKGGHAAHGGAWKVAYADFVTAMMAFFLVMWIVAMDQPAKEGIQKYFQDPIKYLMGSEKINTGIFESSDGAQMVNNKKKGGATDDNKQGGISKLHLMSNEILAGLQNFKSNIHGFKVFPDHIQFAITAESMFSAGSALLRPESEPMLNKLAQVLKSVDANIVVEAHTDDIQPEATEFESNWELTAARAAKVVRYFIEEHTFDPTRLSALGAGDARPAADNRTPAGRADNRRVDLYVIPFKGDGIRNRVPQ